MLEQAQRDDSLVVITPAMPAGSCLRPMMKEFPERCIDVGIAEGHSLTYAAGIARGGNCHVIVAIYSTFFQRAIDNLYHDICIQGLPVVLALDRGGIAGGDGITHNGIYDIGFLNEMPGMVIAQPRNGEILKELFNTCFNWKCPAVIRYPNLSTDESQDLKLKDRPLGCAEILTQGRDVCIVSLGHMADEALKLRQLLIDNHTIEATVIDPIFVKPLDETLFFDVFSSHRIIITLEEHSVRGGLGSILNSFATQHNMNHLQIINFGVPDEFVHHGSHKDLLDQLGLSAPKVYQTLLEKEVLMPSSPIEVPS